MKISNISIGTRHRKDLGDIEGLAASLSDVGLLHPVVVNEAGELIAGERRLAAAKQLGWKEISTTTAKNLEEIAAALRAERDENRCRKDFTPTEAAEMARALEPYEKKAAKEREREAGKIGGQRGSEKFSNPSAGRAADRVAEAVGMSRPTLTKARAVVDAAKADPINFGDLPSKMDHNGKVHPAFEEMQDRAEKLPPRQVPECIPKRRKPTGGEVWCKWIAEITRNMIDTRDAGGIEGLVRSWAPGEVEDYVKQLREYREMIDSWIETLEPLCSKAKVKRAG